ncbi:MAG: TetR/AcrR family transcriptional regulator [Candidatus Omnitrophica bacterium]|nr:TetR/AcrR family transcriptional regulator [Candidatus Omnitrophota bacterium]
MTQKKQRLNCREAILDAAEFVVIKSGAAHMSLDTVARKAGVSKGGLMYHFPTKIDLLKAMVGRLVDEYHRNRANIAAQMNDTTPVGLLKAGIMLNFESDPKRDQMGCPILAVAACAPELLDPIKKAYREHLELISRSGLKFERAAVLSLASDGFMLNNLLGLCLFNKTQKKMILQKMLQMVDEAVNR